jgi:SAM-dependent methyltransferase
MQFRMNSPQGKSILAMVRGGDYAHPGEESAIMQVAQNLPRASIRRLLDVGCGRGGTAQWFHLHGWGTVVGVDIDGPSIEYARQRYPGIDFVQLDVVQIDALNRELFDLAYLFNSFYAFPDQRAALRAIRAACKPGALLLVYDYTKPTGGTLPDELGAEIGKPIVLDQVGAWLAESKWQLSSIDDWTDRYVTAYDDLLERFIRHRAAITTSAGEAWYEYVTGWYGALRQALATGSLGGTVLTALAVP